MYAPTQLQNFYTKTSFNKSQNLEAPSAVVNAKPCKFCSAFHSLIKCPKYDTVDKRLRRCREINLCCNCSSNRHVSDSCPAKEVKLSFPCTNCSSSSHISALCPKLSKTNINRVETHCQTLAMHSVLPNLSQRSLGTLLPTMTIKFKSFFSNFCVKVRCLLDMASQKSYLSPSVLRKLGCGKINSPFHNYDIKTFAGVKNKNIQEVKMEVSINSNELASYSFLIDEDMDLNHSVPGLKNTILKLKQQGVPLADEALHYVENDTLGNIECLLGMDVLQDIFPFYFIRLNKGSAIMTHQGLIPIGQLERLGDSGNLSVTNQCSDVAEEVVGSACSSRLDRPVPVTGTWSEELLISGLNQGRTCTGTPVSTGMGGRLGTGDLSDNSHYTSIPGSNQKQQKVLKRETNQFNQIRTSKLKPPETYQQS